MARISKVSRENGKPNLIGTMKKKVILLPSRKIPWQNSVPFYCCIEILSEEKFSVFKAWKGIKVSSEDIHPPSRPNKVCM